MALKTLILCNSPREGGHYAKRAELARWTYRVVTNVGQIKGLPFKGVEIHILPSFATRRNRAALLGALRYKRGEFFYVDPDDLPTLEDLAADRQAETQGELDDDTLEAAYAEQAEFPHAEWDAARRRSQIAGMTDEEVSELLTREPEQAAEVVATVKATEAARPRKPRPPRQATTPAAPAPSTSAANFFGTGD